MSLQSQTRGWIRLMAAVLLAGCGRPDAEPTASPLADSDIGTHSAGLTLNDNLNRLSSQYGNFGVDLQRKVMDRASGIAPQNRPYIFNGIQDCWGYVRQTWNAVLYDGGTHPEDYYPNPYDRSRWLGISGGLLTADAPNADWLPITDWNELVAGDLLSTAQGHAWGDTWHGGIFAGRGADGVFYDWDNSSSMNGAYHRAVYSGFKYYYRPVHQLLVKATPVAGVGTNGDGRLEVFMRGRDGAIYHSWQTAPNGGWSGWYSLGGNLAGNPVVGRNADGRLSVFVRGPSRDLWTISQSAGGWSGWSGLGGKTDYDPAVASNQDGRLTLAVRATNASVYALTQGSPNGAFGPWQVLGGSITGRPTLENRQDGGLELFGRWYNGAPYHAWQLAPNSGSWSGWQTLTGNIRYETVAKRHADGRVFMFARGTDDALYYVNQTAPNSGWSGWTLLGGTLSSEPAVGINTDGSMMVFARGGGGAVFYRRLTAAGWSAWGSLGGVTTSTPAVGRYQDGRLAVFARGDTGIMYVNVQSAPGSDSWSGWQFVGDSVARF